MSRVMIFLMGLCSFFIASLLAMNEKKEVVKSADLEMIEFQKEFKYQLAKWPMIALREVDIPQELRSLILRLYLERSYDEKQCKEMKSVLTHFNDNGKKLTLIDIMQLNSQDRDKLVPMKKIIGKLDLYKDVVSGLVEDVLKNESEEVLSLPLWLRCKLGIKCSKSVKWPMQALKQLGISDIKKDILLLYTKELNYYNDLFSSQKESLMNSKSIRLNLADLMWIDEKDKKKLILAEKALQCKDKYRVANNPHSIIDRSYNKILTDEEYKEVVTLRLDWRCKLGARYSRSGPAYMVAVQAGKYDLKPEEKEKVFDHSMLGGSVGVGLYFVTTRINGAEFSWPLAIASYGIGAGCVGVGSWQKIMNKKRETPDSDRLPWIKEKPLCPEMVTPFNKEYWLPQSKWIQLRMRE